MKTFEIQDKKQNILESFDEMTYKKAVKKMGKKYDDQNVILSYINKKKNQVVHQINRGVARCLD